MKSKNLKIFFIVTSILVVGGLTFFLYKKQQNNKIREAYKTSLEEMEAKYGKELFN